MHTSLIISVVKINTLKLYIIEIQYLLYHSEGWLYLGKKHINTLSVDKK